MKLLVISNGHGEDIIAVKIIQQLKQILPTIDLACLPMVGKGFAYQQQNIKMIAPVKSMPSGGFVNMDQKQLWSDIRHGLIGLTIRQYQGVKAWVKNGGKILAVGDVLPLLVAWLAGGEYFFVGTAKSEYHRQNENGFFHDISSLERYGDSIYYPWECWLMKHQRCLGVFPRDEITTIGLQKLGISAHNLGNPMIDDLETDFIDDNSQYKLKVLLLPGSRMPEAIDNWQLILQGVDSIINTTKEDFICLAAIAPSLSLEQFENCLSETGWLKKTIQELDLHQFASFNVLSYFQKGKAKLILSQQAYNQSLNYCNLGLAMAGTATEQFVGLGKCAIAFPGVGPQYNLQFANNQKRLLGKSLQLLNHPQEVGSKIQQLLSTPLQWQEIEINGKKRLGEVGASARIAQFVKQKYDK